MSPAAPSASSVPGLTPRRVVVTGMGALSPAGAGLECLDELPAAAAGPLRIPGFDPAQYIASPKLLRSMHRTFQIATASAVLAMRAAELPTADRLPAAGIAPERAGLASALADISPLTRDLLLVLAQVTADDRGEAVAWDRFAEISLHELHPFRRLTLLANMAGAHTSLLFGLQGPSYTFTTGAMAGAQTVSEAWWKIAANRADFMLCQASSSPDQAFSPMPEPELGGGLVLEELETAQRRGAPLQIEILPARAALRLDGGAHPEAVAPARSLLSALARIAHAAPGSALALDDLLGTHANSSAIATTILQEAS